MRCNRFCVDVESKNCLCGPFPVGKKGRTVVQYSRGKEESRYGGLGVFVVLFLWAFLVWCFFFLAFFAASLRSAYILVCFSFPVPFGPIEKVISPRITHFL